MTFATPRALGTMVALLVASFLLGQACPGQAQQSGKIEVKDLSELPVHTYKIEGTVSELLNAGRPFFAFADQVGHDIQQDLRKYDIKDKATLQKMYNSLVALDLLEDRPESALTNLEKVRELEDKEAVRLTTGLVAESIIYARKQSLIAPDAATYKAAFKRHFGDLVYALPWDVVQDRIKEAKGRAEIITENFLQGLAEGQLDPIVAKTGELSSELAQQVLALRVARQVILPVREEQIAVYQEMISRNKTEKPDIWAAREVTLDKQRQLAPVVVGIWDSGVDGPIFTDQLYVNDKEKLDGRDDDGNGFVDDVHGIAYDLNAQKQPELLYPLGPDSDRIAKAMQYMKGFMDLQASVDSPEASAVREQMGSLQPDQVTAFLEDLGLCGLYAHGTHVAGIAARGNPFVRLLPARITFDYHRIPQPLSVELAHKHAESYQETAEYFRDAGVRVVNMSWGWTYREIESGLEANGIGPSAEERSKLARQILDILSDGLRSALAGTPDILYVCAAGNEDSDVAFDVFIPASFELPNLLVVGAVDQAGERTSFTSMGKNVVVYANGFEVNSYVPGGERMKMSGTSMASPNVTNLAAKLLALSPALTPGQTIALIKRGADHQKANPDLLLINPKATVAQLESQ